MIKENKIKTRLLKMASPLFEFYAEGTDTYVLLNDQSITDPKQVQNLLIDELKSNTNTLCKFICSDYMPEYNYGFFYDFEENNDKFENIVEKQACDLLRKNGITEKDINQVKNEKDLEAFLNEHQTYKNDLIDFIIYGIDVRSCNLEENGKLVFVC